MAGRDEPPRKIPDVTVLGADWMPACITATQANAAEPWCADVSRARSHMHWRVRTVDPGKKKMRHTATLSFDGPVALGMTLADPVRAADARTKRELLIQALTIGFGNGPLGATAAAAFALKYDWLVRWRLDLSIHSFSALQLNDYDAFLTRLRIGTVLDLVDIPARLDAWAAGIGRGALPTPLSTIGATTHVDRAMLAMQLGMTTAALSRSPTFDDLLDIRLARLVPGRTCGVSDIAPALGPKKPATTSAMAGYLGIWRCLAIASRGGLLPHDPLRFDPADRGTPSRLAGRLGAPGTRTATVEPPRMFTLLLSAALYVLEDGPLLAATLADYATMKVGATPMHEPDYCGVPFAVAVRHLMAACAILLGGLAGRRIGETESARVGCMRETKPGLHEIELFVEKSIQDLDGIVVPALVATAVHILEKLTASSRKMTGERWLFRLVLPSGRIVNFQPSVDLPAFAAARDWDAGSIRATLASHQLRRGFALALYHGYALGSLEAVGRQLRHGGPGSSATYVTEAQGGGTIRLRDDLAARFSVSLTELSEADRTWLRVERARLCGKRISGAPFDDSRCEKAALALLEAWPDEAPNGGKDVQATPMDRFRHMKKRAAATIRIGSQARRLGDPADPPLIDVIRAHAAVLFGFGAA